MTPNPQSSIKTVLTLGDKSWDFPPPNSMNLQTEYGWEKIELGSSQIMYEAMSGTGPEYERKDALSAIERAFMQTNAFNAGAISSINQGRAPNPRESVIFKGVSRRTYSLDFLIVDRSGEEVRKKAHAINELYREASPLLEDNEMFFTYPSTGTLEIQDGGVIVLPTREIAVTSVSHNLNPNQHYATWSNGVPVSFTLSLGIIELRLPTRDNDHNLMLF